MRAFKELGQDAEFSLQLAWRKLRERRSESSGSVARDTTSAVLSASTIPSSTPPTPRRRIGGLVGRGPEWTRLSGAAGRGVQ